MNFSNRAQRDRHLNLGSGLRLGQNFGIGLGSGSGLKMAPGFFGSFDLKQQDFSQFNQFEMGTLH
jgi:hypothetical protein